jgi:hypothetical protein
VLHGPQVNISTYNYPVLVCFVPFIFYSIEIAPLVSYASISSSPTFAYSCLISKFYLGMSTLDNGPFGGLSQK